jgi:hypothetical protein
MQNLFKALSENLSRFIFSWLLPSAISLWLFMVLVLPDARKFTIVATVVPHLKGDFLPSAAFALTAISLAAIFGYTARPVYQLLEGYTLPRALKAWLRKRQLLEWHRLSRLNRLAQRLPWFSQPESGMGLEKLQRYPTNPRDILPTQLGNALYSMEQYGSDRFELDSQLFWFELLSVASEDIRRNTAEMQAQVDFFVASVTHLAVLGLLALVVALGAPDRVRPAPALAAIGSILLIRPAYLGAVASVRDWRYAIQALVNTGRYGLADALGLRMPRTFEAEREMWRSMGGYVAIGDRGFLPPLNSRRRRPQTQT